MKRIAPLQVYHAYDRPFAAIEAMDERAMADVDAIRLPGHGQNIDWGVSRVSPSSELNTGKIVFVVGHGTNFRNVGRRVERHREAGHTAVGACIGTPRTQSKAHPGVLRVKASRAQKDLRKFFTVLTALTCEGPDRVTIGVDWQDVVDLLNLPGELFLEWSQGANAMTSLTVPRRMKARIKSRTGLGMLCVLGGGKNRWFYPMRIANRECSRFLPQYIPTVVADSFSAFRGKPGCCLMVVAA